MSWQHIRMARFGGPEVLELAEQRTIPEPGPGVLAARVGQLIADLCVISGYVQHAIHPARFLVPLPVGVDMAAQRCASPSLSYRLSDAHPLPTPTAGCNDPRRRRLRHCRHGAARSARHLGLKAIGTCSAANLAVVERFGAAAIDYRAGDFVASVRGLTTGGAGVDAPSMLSAARISTARTPASRPAGQQRNIVKNDGKPIAEACDLKTAEEVPQLAECRRVPA